MKKNIFLTGPPSSGKTTIIKKVIKKLGLPANGFYTEEERAYGKRIGFIMSLYLTRLVRWNVFPKFSNKRQPMFLIRLISL
ncbi:MAG: nucleoside-triphosphatase [Desulfobacterales bacterium]|nr:nucleoside-triphosphatase [Desulfobacterales bacterium]